MNIHIFLITIFEIFEEIFCLYEAEKNTIFIWDTLPMMAKTDNSHQPIIQEPD